MNKVTHEGPTLRSAAASQLPWGLGGGGQACLKRPWPLSAATSPGPSHLRSPGTPGRRDVPGP